MDEIQQIAETLIQQAGAANHRRCLVLAGQREWCLRCAGQVAANPALERVLWVSDAAPASSWAMPAERAHAVLGSELDAVVFDAHAGFHPDAFGAVSGTIRGGGLLVLLAPPLDAWSGFTDPDHARIAVAPFGAEAVTGRFLQRLVDVLRGDSDVSIVEERGVSRVAPIGPVAPNHDRPAGTGPARDDLDLQCRTTDQRQAVDAILRVATGRARRPVVLTSDRGRGKSAALGIAAAHLLRQGVQRIVVTAPRLESAARVFEHAQRALPDAQASRSHVRLGQAEIVFVAPDDLIESGAQNGAQLVLVDEAAAIPAFLLTALLEHHARIAFATTVHGYEGTGRGFAVRFNQVLERRTPHWRALRMTTPIRWASGDPVERLVFRALLLDAAAAPDERVADARPDVVQTVRLDRDLLVRDQALLSELFGLLVLAHYRTRPFDLRLLLDAPNVSVYVQTLGRHVVGTALVAAEGGLSREQSWQVWAGQRRPHGHLIPESLAAHGGLDHAPLARCARIMRIAVHPAARARGLGTALVGAIVESARADGFDYAGSSFGASAELLRFWRRCRFTPVRVSVTRGGASGTHSAMVLRPLSVEGQRIADEARERLHDQFPHQLAEPLSCLEPELVNLVMADRAQASLSSQDWRDLVAFGFGGRVYEACMAALWRLAPITLAGDGSAQAQALSNVQRDALILKVLQRRSWAETARELNASGRGEVVQILRAGVRRWIRSYGPESVREEAARLAHSTRDAEGSRE